VAMRPVGMEVERSMAGRCGGMGEGAPGEGLAVDEAVGGGCGAQSWPVLRGKGGSGAASASS